MAGKQRYFGGRLYTWHDTHSTKKSATEQARRIRKVYPGEKSRFFARIVEADYGKTVDPRGRYDVYTAEVKGGK